MKDPTSSQTLGIVLVRAQSKAGEACSVLDLAEFELRKDSGGGRYNV